MKNFTFLFISFIILFSTVVYFTFTISDNLSQYHNMKTQMAEKLDFKQRFSDYTEYIPFFGTGQEKVELWQSLEISSKHYYKKALINGGVLAIIVLAFAGANFLFYKSKPHKYQIYGLVMVFASLSFLYLGLQSPFLEIEAFSQDLTLSQFEFTFEGRMYYMYQNKSVLELIKLLYMGGNFTVAICLILASIVFPITKLISSIFVFMNPHKKSSKKLVKIINAMGKWSMADVFVAAIFLAYFSFANTKLGVDTGSTTLIGTYFFLAFVILSILSGAYFKKLTGKGE